MLRKLSILLVLVMMVFSIGTVRAQEAAAQETSYPEQMSAGNPYASSLKEAKQGYEDALKRYQDAYRYATYSWAYYQAYYRAYYDLWAAYTRYVWYLRAYWWHERSLSFTGRVAMAEVYFLSIRPAPAPAVAGATVQLMTYVPPGSRRAVQLLGTRTTDQNGRFRFDGFAAGTYTYSVEKTGFTAVRGDIQIRAGMSETEILMRRSRGVSGTILARPLFGMIPVDPPAGYFDPRPLQGVRVTLYRTDVVYIRAPDPDATAMTGPDGRFEFPDVSFSRARVVLEKVNYRTVTEDVVLTSGSASVRVVMEYTGPPPPRPAEATFDDINRR